MSQELLCPVGSTQRCLHSHPFSSLHLSSFPKQDSWQHILPEKQRKWSLLLTVIPHTDIQLWNQRSTFSVLSQWIISPIDTRLNTQNSNNLENHGKEVTSHVHRACGCWKSSLTSPHSESSWRACFQSLSAVFYTIWRIIFDSHIWIY